MKPAFSAKRLLVLPKITDYGFCYSSHNRTLNVLDLIHNNDYRTIAEIAKESGWTFFMGDGDVERILEGLLNDGVVFRDSLTSCFRLSDLGASRLRRGNYELVTKRKPKY